MQTMSLEEMFGDAVVEKAKTLVTKARQRLSFQHVFYGARIFATPCAYSSRRKTFWTDGVMIWVNPKFAASLKQKEVVGVLVHELMHIILLHPFRLSRIIDAFQKRYGHLTVAMIHRIANYAMDFALNPLVVSDGFALPEGALLDPKYKGKSFEEIMHILVKDPKWVQRAKEEAEAGDGGLGDVEPYPGDDDAAEEARSKVQTSVREALMSAKALGNEPAWANSLLKDWDEAQVDWREELHRFADACVGPRQESSWERPHRRYMQMGIYMPAKRSVGVGCMVFATDVSGSMSNLETHAGLTEGSAIVTNHQPEVSHFIQFDTAIKGEPEVFHAGDTFPTEVTRRGHGGTDVRPVFDWIRDQGLRPSLLIVVTDGGVSSWCEDPGYPVVWLMTTGVVAPWGKTIRLRVGSN